MKIGINVSFLRKPHTGIGQYTEHLTNAILELPAAQNHAFYLYAENEASLRSIQAGNANVTLKAPKTPFYKRDDLVRKTAWEKAVLPHEAKKDGLDVFFSPYNSVSTFPLIKHAVTLHDVVWKVFAKEYVNNFRKSIYVKQTFEALKKANCVITVSEYSKKEISKHLGLEFSCIRVIKNGIGPQYHPQPENIVRPVLDKFKIKQSYLLYVGGFERRKNVSLLLKAFKIMQENYPNILNGRQLVVVGAAWPKEDSLVTNVAATAGELSLEKDLIVTGAVTEEEKIALLSGADLLVFPSLYEGFGMPVLEAMACGCPVLASNKTSIPEISQDAVEYFNPERQDELIQQLGRLLQEPEELERLREKGLKRASDFSWIKSAQKTLDVLLNLKN